MELLGEIAITVEPIKHLNVWVAGGIMVSVPIKTEKQKKAVEGIYQGPMSGQVFIILEPEARKTL